MNVDYRYLYYGDESFKDWITLPPPKTTNELLNFKRFVVAADNKLCSSFGADVIKNGGNAADALISTHCCLEIVNSQSTGLGGGGFLVYYDRKRKKSKSYDFRETLPLEYENRKKYSQGGKILIPGTLKGLYTFWTDYRSRKVSWSLLWQPCIKLANDGHAIGAAYSNSIILKENYLSTDNPLSHLLKPYGVRLKAGDFIRRPLLAKTFSRIAQLGGEDFYQGTMAGEIVKDIQEAGGTVTYRDMFHYKVLKKKPTEVNIKGLKMLSVPPPAGGPLVSLILKILSNYNWTHVDRLVNPGLVYHYIIEAFKYGYGPSTFIRDPRFDQQANMLSSYMLDPVIAYKKYKRIDTRSHDSKYYEPYNKANTAEPSGTTHISIIDKEGNAVSCSTSLNGNFGSGVMSRRLGIIYNDQVREFVKPWRDIYGIRGDDKIPGKRPMSRLSPIIFVDRRGEVVGVFGAAGGAYIPTALSQVIANWLFFGDNIKKAITLPRMHAQLFPRKVTVEKVFPDHLIRKIQRFQWEPFTNSTSRIGNDVTGPDKIMGVVQAIVRLQDGTYNACSDYRKGGVPDGL